MITSEVELVEQCLAGNISASRQFVETFQGAIFGLCYRMVRQREDAEDITQEVFTRAFRSLASWDRVRPLKPWLLMIAANCSRTALAKRGRQGNSTDTIEDLPARPEESTNSEFADAVQFALASLREDHKTCFILFYDQELSVSEICQIMGCPEGTVKTWLHRARREVAEILRTQGFDNLAD